MRANIHYDDGITGIYSRNGKEFPEILHSVFEEEVKKVATYPGPTSGFDINNKMVLDGEFRVRNEDGTLMDRKTGNGILNSVQQNKSKTKEFDLTRIVFVIWDFTELDEFYAGKSKPYNTYDIRFSKTVGVFSAYIGSYEFTNLIPIESKTVDNMEEANSHFREMRERGEEGTILKNIKSPWVNKRSPDLVKMKAVEEADLEIVELLNGKEGSKYSEILGSIRCKTSCGNLEVNIGSGFSDEQRELYWKNRAELVGKIIACEYNEIIDNKSNTTIKSLFLPIFVEIRLDKDIANTLDELV